MLCFKTWLLPLLSFPVYLIPSAICMVWSLSIDQYFACTYFVTGALSPATPFALSYIFFGSSCSVCCLACLTFLSDFTVRAPILGYDSDEAWGNYSESHVSAWVARCDLNRSSQKPFDPNFRQTSSWEKPFWVVSSTGSFLGEAGIHGLIKRYFHVMNCNWKK